MVEEEDERLDLDSFMVAQRGSWVDLQRLIYINPNLRTVLI